MPTKCGNTFPESKRNNIVKCDNVRWNSPKILKILSPSIKYGYFSFDITMYTPFVIGIL